MALVNSCMRGIDLNEMEESAIWSNDFWLDSVGVVEALCRDSSFGPIRDMLPILLQY